MNIASVVNRFSIAAKWQGRSEVTSRFQAAMLIGRIQQPLSFFVQTATFGEVAVSFGEQPSIW